MMNPKIARALRAAMPEQRRAYPTPPWDAYSEDRIVVQPPTRQDMGFDRMDLMERGWYPTQPAAPDRKAYADGGETKGWFDTISEYTQPVRDFSDSTGNTQFWRDVFTGKYPGLAAAAQFVGRAPVRGTPAYDQAMMKVLDRRAGGPAYSAERFARGTPDDVSVLGRDAQRLPPIREGYWNSAKGLARSEGVRSASNPSPAGQYQPHAWNTMRGQAANAADSKMPLTPYDRAIMDNMIRRQSIWPVE